MNDKFIDCVGIVCLHPETGKVLLIQRGKPPRAGEWSIPGGRIDPGETKPAAALRELKEETSINAELVRKIETINAVFEGYNYRLHDYLAIYKSGEVLAGDDAVLAAFVDPKDIYKLGMWSETNRIIGKAISLFSSYENTNSQ